MAINSASPHKFYRVMKSLAPVGWNEVKPNTDVGLRFASPNLQIPLCYPAKLMWSNTNYLKGNRG